MKRLFMLAYGSNMLVERLAQRIHLLGPVQAAGTYRLPDYKLIFNASGQFANITPAPGQFVEGVLYELNHRQLHELDFYEGLYERQYFTFSYQGQQEIGCVYVCKKPEHLFEGRPRLPYLDICIYGAKQNGLKTTYNKLVAYRLQNYRFKRKSKFFFMD